MGIKFRCPNGHKLNVKSFLAGKRGICPHCGAKVQIPEEAAREEAEEALQSGLGVASATAVATAPARSMSDTGVYVANPKATGFSTSVGGEPTPAPFTTPASMVGATPAPTMSAGSTSAPYVPQGVPVSAAPTGVPVGVAPAAAPMAAAPMMATPMAATPAAPVMADPIAEAPNAVWYVRPPSGGQFGPARGDIMRKWLGEGRVSADSLVWRDGWADWKPAATVFPSLTPTSTPAPVGSAPAAISGLEVSSPAPSRALRARRKSTSFGVAMVVALGLISVVLIGLFIFVITNLNT